jgi:hypothetical protein
MEIREAHAFAMQPVEVRRFKDRMPMHGHVAVALIVSEDEDDVGARTDQRRSR